MTVTLLGLNWSLARRGSRRAVSFTFCAAKISEPLLLTLTPLSDIPRPGHRVSPSLPPTRTSMPRAAEAAASTRGLKACRQSRSASAPAKPARPTTAAIKLNLFL